MPMHSFLPMVCWVTRHQQIVVDSFQAKDQLPREWLRGKGTSDGHRVVITTAEAFLRGAGVLQRENIADLIIRGYVFRLH